MIGALMPGDRVIVLPVRSVAPGDVVAARDPRHPQRILVKRVAGAGPTGIDLRGDNPAASTDSRQFGPVSPDLLVGRVVCRYHPPGRTGWLLPGPASAE
jgi:nickel-type superoxide dismutase maturation protease